mmetsp:Transcript_24561/g.58277  ORF Transcript_24561/g.58277 Transcript_24561/m.58277 type:complete len:295 (+) Transcript_24561:713-1597(+)
MATASSARLAAWSKSFVRTSMLAMVQHATPCPTLSRASRQRANALEAALYASSREPHAMHAVALVCIAAACCAFVPAFSSRSPARLADAAAIPLSWGSPIARRASAASSRTEASPALPSTSLKSASLASARPAASSGKDTAMAGIRILNASTSSSLSPSSCARPRASPAAFSACAASLSAKCTAAFASSAVASPFFSLASPHCASMSSAKDMASLNCFRAICACTSVRRTAAWPGRSPAARHLLRARCARALASLASCLSSFPFASAISEGASSTGAIAQACLDAVPQRRGSRA